VKRLLRAHREPRDQPDAAHAEPLGEQPMLADHVVVHRDVWKRRTIQRRRSVARRRGPAVAEHVRHDDEVSGGIDRAPGSHDDLVVEVIAAEKRRQDDDVVARRAQRAVCAIGEPGIRQNRPGLQHEITEIEQLQFRHIITLCLNCRNI
jgi:hypothetical protein